MLTKQESDKLRKLINERVQASIDMSWVGALPPEERGEVELREARAKRKLNEYIRTLGGSNQRVGS